MANDFLFTSESVSEGHPDKVADQISDGILDAIFEQDPRSRVAAETLCNTGLVVLAGEITTNSHVDYIQVARDVIKRIGYDNTEYGIDYKGCAVMVCYDKQSNDIAQGVDHASDDYLNQGAGDQGLMFGYACDETPTLMPAPIFYAHRLVERQAELRRDGRMPYLRPDAKSQITMRYVDGKPHSIDTVVLSSQHAPEMSDGKKMKPEFVEAVIDMIIKPSLPPEWITKDTKFLINPTGRFVVGGPQGDCGLTGRKIIVDTYGGACPHGGGAFSGKDPSKVDRSAAYAARYVAKNVVAAGLAARSGAVPVATVLQQWPVIATLLAGSLLGAWIGAAWAVRLGAALYRVIALALVGIALVLLLAHEPGIVALDLSPIARTLAGVAAGFAIGVVASLLGVAGGELLIPTLILLFGLDAKVAGSVSLAVSLPTMLVGFARYGRDGAFGVLRANRAFLLALAGGSLVGVVLGGYLLHFVSTALLVPLLAVILLVSAAKLWRHR